MEHFDDNNFFTELTALVFSYNIKKLKDMFNNYN